MKLIFSEILDFGSDSWLIVKILQEKYEAFEEGIKRVKEDQDNSGDTTVKRGQNHPPVIEVQICYPQYYSLVKELIKWTDLKFINLPKIGLVGSIIVHLSQVQKCMLGLLSAWITSVSKLIHPYFKYIQING